MVSGWNRKLVGVAATVTLLSGCEASSGLAGLPLRPLRDVVCDRDNAGLTLLPGFCAVVVADLVVGGSPAHARHLAITPRGDIFVAINAPRNNQPAFGIVGLRDMDGDGRAEQQVQFSPNLGGSGIAWAEGFLFFGANDRILRFRLPSGTPAPLSPPDVVVAGLPSTGDNISKTVVVLDRETLFVNIGSASNACQEQNRVPESPGVFPCPELLTRAGIWQFDATGTDQTQDDGERFGIGFRNMVALAINPRNGELYGVQHGRELLSGDWPQFFTVEENAALPSEEFFLISRRTNGGWPYCYHDNVFEHAKVLAPEYGGDGQLPGGGPNIFCASFLQPLTAYPAHWAPNGMHFYRGNQFPGRFRGGVFIAFHGGFDRFPFPNEGYVIGFQPMASDGTPAGPLEIFAAGFAGSAGPLPQTALHRPVGVTEGPDGSLYVSDDVGGRIYRILFIGG